MRIPVLGVSSCSSSDCPRNDGPHGGGRNGGTEWWVGEGPPCVGHHRTRRHGRGANQTRGREGRGREYTHSTSPLGPWDQRRRILLSISPHSVLTPLSRRAPHMLTSFVLNPSGPEVMGTPGAAERRMHQAKTAGCIEARHGAVGLGGGVLVRASCERIGMDDVDLRGYNAAAGKNEVIRLGYDDADDLWRQHRCAKGSGKTARKRPKAGAVRYGEAQHPGPGSGGAGHGVIREGAAAYRDPAQVGFWNAHLPTANDPVPSQDQDYFSLAIETVNGTAWGSMYNYLMTATAAHIILCQEHHLGPADIPAASAAALRIGWQSIFVPATPGSGEGWRGGVAVFARRFVGLSPPRVGTYEVVPARALAVMAEAPGYRPFVALSVYLEHGHGVDAVNLHHLEQVGAFLEMQGEHVPFVLGGDFQADPSDLARAGFARRSGGSLVAARSPRGTCRSSTATSELDFFYVHNSMTAGLKQVAVVEGAGTTPHLPVRLLFHPRLTSARSLVLRHPPKMEVERICGPRPATTVLGRRATKRSRTTGQRTASGL